MKSVVADSHFDGERYRTGVLTVVIDGGRIVDLLDGEHAIGQCLGRHAFAMPGLVEAHCHLFLNGADLDPARRSAHLQAPLERMMETARENIERCIAHGVTLVRDAGDRYGVNHRMRAESSVCQVRSAGIALRRPGRYGAFMAREVANADEVRAAVLELAGDADDLKIIETGIIDFDAGVVKGAPQFDRESLGMIVQLAHDAGIPTFAHCSGAEGIEIAVDAGVDSIEHGFFMTRDLLRRMSDRGTAWVPTFSPVDFPCRNPEAVGFGDGTVAKLRAILDAHREHVAMAADMGVNLLAGSDAGSLGVDHGQGLVDEIFHFLHCGIPMEQALRAAGSRPRKLWGVEPNDLRVGCRADLVVMQTDPFVDAQALRRGASILR